MTKSAQYWESDSRCIHIGLVNNMPDAALAATERQFETLLRKAGLGLRLRLSLLYMPELPRSDRARRRLSSSYSAVSSLWNTHLDGLIVTGAEPVTRDLTAEPFWATITKLIEWSEQNTFSSVWSCLAAHAAVLRIDGIKRRPFTHKLFGVFECSKHSEHFLTKDVSPNCRIPHSRWNDIPAEALSSCNYSVLTSLKDGTVDAFLKQRRNLFVFFQGHPEYEADSLFLEYRRDIRRFLKFEIDSYPSMPYAYFTEELRAAFLALRERALMDRREESLANVPSVIRSTPFQSTWKPEALTLYRNWLHYLSDQKAGRCKSRLTGIKAIGNAMIASACDAAEETGA